MYANAEKTATRKKRGNSTGIPDEMKKRFENASGYSFDDVKVHYNSDKPARLRANAYTKGDDVFVAPGQEEHIPHELGHVVQQKKGIVKPTESAGGVPVNSDPAMEDNADVMARRAKSGEVVQRNALANFKDVGGLSGIGSVIGGIGNILTGVANFKNAFFGPKKDKSVDVNKESAAAVTTAEKAATDAETAKREADTEQDAGKKTEAAKKACAAADRAKFAFNTVKKYKNSNKENFTVVNNFEKIKEATIKAFTFAQEAMISVNDAVPANAAKPFKDGDLLKYLPAKIVIQK
ncbi:MAG: DUF4157 domain-containing protein [Oscillospiraceae bacterium]|jgi:hypothetical protein|nr:DUF4157 domain-containing protein [Oscillospiraceae bacterium]